jgi:hypothetical protein
MKVKAVFYLPVRDNDGRSLLAEIEEVREQLFVWFDGWTRLGFVTGGYRMADNSEAMDVSAAYMVIIDDSQIGDLEEMLREFKRQTLQEAIYLEIQHDLDVRFL